MHVEESLCAYMFFLWIEILPRRHVASWSVILAACDIYIHAIYISLQKKVAIVTIMSPNLMTVVRVTKGFSHIF